MRCGSRIRTLHVYSHLHCVHRIRRKPLWIYPWHEDNRTFDWTDNKCLHQAKQINRSPFSWAIWRLVFANHPRESVLYGALCVSLSQSKPHHRADKPWPISGLSVRGDYNTAQHKSHVKTCKFVAVNRIVSDMLNEAAAVGCQGFSQLASWNVSPLFGHILASFARWKFDLKVTHLVTIVEDWNTIKIH